MSRTGLGEVRHPRLDPSLQLNHTRSGQATLRDQGASPIHLRLGKLRKKGIWIGFSSERFTIIGTRCESP